MSGHSHSTRVETETAQAPAAAEPEAQTREDPRLEDESTTKNAESLEHDEDNTQYPSGLKLFVIISSLFLAIFLVALDRTIIANAIPKITDDFHSLDDIGWYGSSFLLTSCSTLLLYGKIYTLFSPKGVFLSAIGIFEVGSAVCGAAPSSTAFIVGRAIAGLGAAGVMAGAIVIIVHTIPLHRRPIFQGLFGAVFGMSFVVGPLLGGVFTDKVSWRWCFYINLPIVAATMVAHTFFLKIPTGTRTTKLTLREFVLKMDPIGTLFFLPGIVCLLLALHWGGTKYNWSSGRLVALLVLAGSLLVSFIIVQIFAGESATVPPRIMKQRSVAFGFWWSTCVGASMMVMVYYLPLWFQAVKGSSAIKSGIELLALIIALVAGTFVGGALTFKTGYYTPCMLISSVIGPVGAGLISTWKVDEHEGKWIGYQVIYGFGLGMGMQQANLGVQTVLAKKDVPIGASLMFFGLTLGGTVFISVAQSDFSQKLLDALRHINGIDVLTVFNTGATDIRHVVPPGSLGQVLEAFNGALMRAVYVSLAMWCAGVIGALGMEWKSVKKGEGQGKKEEQDKMEGQGKSDANLPKSEGEEEGVQA